MISSPPFPPLSCIAFFSLFLLTPLSLSSVCPKSSETEDQERGRRTKEEGMGGAEEDWVEAAMMDDSMVAELLMRLHQSENPPPPAKIPVEFMPLEWGMRQPRSRPVLRCNNIIIQVKKEGGESTRASPTTPLSWSGGTSVSGGAGGAGGCAGGDDVAGGSGGGGDGGSGGDCYEESSRPVKGPSGVRSKVIGSSEATNRRTRKKKTFAELKEEECLLLKENNNLKKEMANFRLDLQLQSAKQIGTSDVLKETCNQSRNSEINQAPTILPTSGGGVCCERDDAAACPASCPSDTCEMPSEAAATQKSSVFIPDLNLPLDEGPGPEDLYGMS